jgi:hypothetical protein
MLGLVDKRLPERFWPGEENWRWLLTALVARIADIADSMRALAEPHHQADALILLRALYEYVVVFLWLAIDPAERVDHWFGHSILHRRAQHYDALKYGIEGPTSVPGSRRAS